MSSGLSDCRVPCAVCWGCYIGACLDDKSIKEANFSLNKRPVYESRGSAAQGVLSSRST